MEVKEKDLMTAIILGQKITLKDSFEKCMVNSDYFSLKDLLNIT